MLNLDYGEMIKKSNGYKVISSNNILKVMGTKNNKRK